MKYYKSFESVPITHIIYIALHLKTFFFPNMKLISRSIDIIAEHSNDMCLSS